jgi:hypothetical protein
MLHDWRVPRHVIVCEVPKLSRCRVKVDVSPAVHVASAVAHPDIKACVCQDEAETPLGSVEHPGRTAVQQSMLQQYCRPAG